MPIILNRGAAKEIIFIGTFIGNNIFVSTESEEIKEIALNDGMTTMLQDGFNKALVGLTTIEEVLHETQTTS